MSKRWLGLAVILVFAAALVGLGWHNWQHGQIYPTTDNAYVDADVTPVASRIPGTLLQVNITNDGIVREGDVIAELDPRDFDQAVAKQQATLATAEAAVALQEARIAGARAQVAAAEAQTELARTDLERFTALDERGSAARRQYDQALAASRVAEAQLVAARKSLQAAEAGLAADQAAVRKAHTGLDNAVLQRSYCTIVAPCDGIVADKSAAAGQVVAPGQPLCRLARLAGEHVWIAANFKETQLKRIRVGQPVSFRIDADDSREFKGHVASLSAGSGAAFSLLPPENATGNWIKVVQRLPVRIDFDEEVPARLLRLGLSCEVTVDTSGLEQ